MMGRPRALLAVALGVLAGAPGPARGAEKDDEKDDERPDPPVVIPSDRPGFADATASVPFGRLVIETGGDLSLALEDRADPVLDVPTVLLRVGLPLGVEARVGVPTPAFRFDAQGEQSTVGVRDLALGAKLSLTDDPLFDFSGVVTVTVPLQDADFGADDDLIGRLGLNLGISPVDFFTLTGAFYGGWSQDNLQLGLGAVASFALGPVSPFAQVFVTREAATLSEAFADGTAELFTETWALGIGGGVAVLLSNELQLDASLDLLPYQGRNVDLPEAVTVALPSALRGDGPVAMRIGVGLSVML